MPTADLIVTTRRGGSAQQKQPAHEPLESARAWATDPRARVASEALGELGTRGASMP